MVRDKHSRHGHMAPPQMPGAHAEIVLLPITLSEKVLAQETSLVETFSTNVEAEAVAGRHLDDFGLIHLGRQCGQVCCDAASGQGLGPSRRG